jgi:hypothetical protein
MALALTVEGDNLPDAQRLVDWTLTQWLSPSSGVAIKESRRTTLPAGWQNFYGDATVCIL